MPNYLEESFNQFIIMKNYLFLFLLLGFVSCKSGSSDQVEETTEMDHSGHQAPKNEEQKSKSPRTTAMAMVDGNHVHIDFSSPSMRGRQIFGGLVAFDEVWVTGAHKATSIQIDKPIQIEGKKIPAGKYGFFTIPGEKEWIVILNQDWDMHLADDYTQEKDIIRFPVIPIKLNQPVESLTFQVNPKDNNQGEILFAWADTQVSFNFQND